VIDSEKESQTILSFDWGEKRIGVALKLSGQIFAKPLMTLYTKAPDLWTKINHLIVQYQPDILLVGRPLNLEGEKTLQTTKTESFAKQLAQKTNLKVKLQDETLTSFQAVKKLPRKIGRQQRKELIDQFSAQIILEDYLNEN